MIKLERTLLGIILFLAIWQVLAICLDANTIVPGLGAIFSELTGLVGKKTFLVAVVSTLVKVIAGLLLTLLIGLPLGFLLGINNKLFDMFRPVIMVIQAVPVISWLTLVIFAWGIGFRGPIFITFLSLFPIALLTTVSGVRNLDKNLLEMATLYRVPRWQVIRDIYLGSLLPFIVAILDVTLGQAWKVILVSEYLCGNSGLGVLILAARYEVNPAKVWALTFLAVLLGLITERLVKLLFRKVAKKMGNLIVITNLAKSFDDKKVLDNINLSICKSERAALIGPSGSGKTTLLRIISGLETPSQGTVQIHTRNIGYVFQEPRLIPWRTVEQNLLFVNPDAELEDILAKLRLKDFKNHYPHQLSGGMKQRVNLARALITNPDLLILDEPFSSLDLPIKLEIINDVLLQWQERKFTMILVTHDLKEALLLADRIIILSSSPGRIIKDLTVDLNPVNRKISDPALLSIESDILHVLSSAY